MQCEFQVLLALGEMNLRLLLLVNVHHDAIESKCVALRAEAEHAANLDPVNRSIGPDNSCFLRYRSAGAAGNPQHSLKSQEIVRVYLRGEGRVSWIDGAGFTAEHPVE